jgi:hypothetical protein
MWGIEARDERETRDERPETPNNTMNYELFISVRIDLSFELE